MAKKLKVITLPDSTSVSRETILRAALYFDEVYLPCFVPTDTKVLDGSLKVTISPFPWMYKELRVLQDAGVLRDVPLTNSPNPVESFSSRELSISLREAVAKSMKQGTSLFAACYLSISPPGAVPAEKIELQIPYQFTIDDPSYIDDPKVELAICLHLVSFFQMLGFCADGEIKSLVDHPEHARLFTYLAKEFPAVARALGIEIPSFEAKHTGVALKILEDCLPDLRPGSAEDILVLREAMKDELAFFRAEVGRLATTISSQQ